MKLLRRLIIGAVLLTGTASLYALSVVPEKVELNNDTLTHTLIFYKPPVQAILPDEIDETSGLIYWDHSIFTMNDSGNKPILYRIDTLTGKITQRIGIVGSVNHDWEALTQDEHHIYIGDVGDNFGRRRELTIYVLDKSMIPEKGDTLLAAKQIHFNYPDKRPAKVKRMQNNFDCESLVAIDDSLYLFSKDWGDQHTRCYRLPKTPGSYTAQELFTYNVKGLITAATYQKKDKILVLLGYTKGDWIPFMWVLYDFPDHHFFDGKKLRIDMPRIIATQTEGITLSHGLKGYISSEGNKLFQQTMDRIDLEPLLQRVEKREKASQQRKFKFALKPLKDKKGTWELVVPASLHVDELQLSLLDASGKKRNDFATKLVREKRKVHILLLLQDVKPGQYTLVVDADGNSWQGPIDLKGDR